MTTLYFTCGLGFSGKSTLTKRIVEEKDAKLVSQDAIWFANQESMNLDLESDEDWEKILVLSRAEVKRLLTEGHSVVYDDICLRRADRERMRALAQECGAQAVLIFVDTPREVREARRLKNLETGDRHDVAVHILEWGETELEPPQEDEDPFVFKPGTDLAEWLKTLP